MQTEQTTVQIGAVHPRRCVYERQPVSCHHKHALYIFSRAETCGGTQHASWHGDKRIDESSCSTARGLLQVGGPGGRGPRRPGARGPRRQTARTFSRRPGLLLPTVFITATFGQFYLSSLLKLILISQFGKSKTNE